VAVAIKHC